MSVLSKAFQDMKTDDNARKKWEQQNPDLSSYTVTVGNNTYNYSSDDLDMMSKVYRKKVNSDSDYAQKAFNSYTGSDFDKFAYEHNLPSWKNWSSIQNATAKYTAGGSLASNYGALTDREWKKINELWQQDWQYGLTDEDARRQAVGLAPVSYDDMYEDTLLDDELKAQNLPPSKLLSGKLGEAYNVWADNDNKYNDIMGQIARENAKHVLAEDGVTLNDVMRDVLNLPENYEFTSEHYGALETLPVLESKKYEVLDENGFNVKDENGNNVYDETAWTNDYMKASLKNGKINSDEFSLTPEKIEKYWGENAGYYTAEQRATEYYSKLGVTPTQEDLVGKIADFGLAESVNDGAGFTWEDVFGDMDIAEASRERYQALVDKANTRLREQGYTSASTYFTSGEFGADLRKIAEDEYVATYRQQFSDVPEAQNKTDDEIIDTYYQQYQTRYGLTNAEVAQLRAGKLNLNEYMHDKVKTTADAQKFADERLARELSGMGVPTTLEEIQNEQVMPDWFMNLYNAANSTASSLFLGGVNSILKLFGVDLWDKIGAEAIGDKLIPGSAEYIENEQKLHDAANFYEAMRVSYYADALQYTDDFEQKTADMDYVNRRFEKLVQEHNNALGSGDRFGDAFRAINGIGVGALFNSQTSSVADLMAHATDEEKKQLVYMADTLSFQDGKGNVIVPQKVEDFLNDVLMRRWDVAEHADRIAEKDWYKDDDVAGIWKVLGGAGLTLAAVSVQPFEAVSNLASDSVAMIAGKDIYASTRSTWADDEIAMIANNITEDAGSFWASAYQLVPSMIQSAGGAVAAYFTGGATEYITLALMATQAYSSTVQNALLNGASTDEAFWFGIASGAAEALFEKVSLDTLTDGMRGVRDVLKNTASSTRKQLAADLFKTILKNSFVSGLVEGSEEAFTSLSNLMAERFILGYDSSMEQLKRRYMDAGLSEEEAEDRVMRDNAMSVFWDFIGGVASGALMGVGTNLITSGNGIKIDQANIKQFTDSVQSISGISYEDATNVTKEVAQYDTNNSLTMDGAQNVVSALRERGADAKLLARITNDITNENTQNDVMTYLNNTIREQEQADKIKMVEAAERVLAVQNPYNLSREYVNAFASRYVDEISEAVQKGDKQHIEDIARSMQRGFTDEITRRSGGFQRAGAVAVSEYIASLDDTNRKLVTDQAAKMRAKFAETSSKLTGEQADNYALYAAAMMHMTGSKVQSADFVRASNFMFGKSATAIPMAIRNACLNSNGAGARAFVDSALEAIALHGDSDRALLMNQLASGMSSAQYAISALALASQRAQGSQQRGIYDYVMRRGVSETSLNMLAAALKYESMNGNAKKAAEADYKSNKKDAVMTSETAQGLADEHAKLREDYDAKKRNYELAQERAAVSNTNAEALVVRYQAEYDAFHTDTTTDENGNPVPSVPTDMRDAAEKTNTNLQDAIKARDKLAAENEGKVNDAKNEMDAAEKKLDKFEAEYNKKLNRQVVAYMKHMESFVIAMQGKDAPTLSALDRANALFTYGTAEDLNNIEKKMVAAEKAKAVALGNAIGITVEVAEFTPEYCQQHGCGSTSEKGFEKNGKVYLNSNMFHDKTGVRAITGVGTNYVLLHEFGHVAEKSTKQYNMYYRFAMSYMTEELGQKAIDDWVKKVQQRKGYDKAKAQREVVAEFTRKALLTDPRAINALCKEAPVMSTRILQWLTNVNHSLFGDVMARSSTITKAQRWYAKALKASGVKANKTGNGQVMQTVKDTYRESKELQSVAAPSRAQADAKAEAKVQAQVQAQNAQAVQQEQQPQQSQESQRLQSAADRFRNLSSDEQREFIRNRGVADNEYESELVAEYEPESEQTDDDFIPEPPPEEPTAVAEPESVQAQEDFASQDSAASYFNEIDDVADNYSVAQMDDEYMPLAQKVVDGTATREDLRRLRTLVEAAAVKRGVAQRKNGRPLNLYRGTTYFSDKSENLSLTPNMIFTTTDKDVASGYSHNRYMNDDSRVRKLTQQYIEDDGTDETLIANAKNILGLSIRATGDGMYVDRLTGEPFSREELQSDIEKFKDRGIYHLYGFEGNQYDVDTNGAIWNEIDNSEFGETTDDIAENAKLAGYDSSRIRNVIDGSASMNAGTDNVADDLVFYRTNDVKSADLVTLDDNGNIIPLSQRFDRSNPEFRYFTELDALNEAINVMSDQERTMYGSPHMFATSKGLMVRRLVSAEGYESGDPTRGGERVIAMIAPADRFMAGNTAVLHRPLAIDECSVVVIPSSLEYGEFRTDARERGVNVYAYDDASEFDTAQELAVEKDNMSYFLDDDLTYEGYINTYGVIPAGASPRMENRPVPKRTARNNRVSRAYRTMMESTGTTDATAEKMKEFLVENGIGSYMPQSNVRSIEKGRAAVDRYGSLREAAAALHGNVAAATGRNTDLLAQAEVLFARMQTDDSLTDEERAQIISDVCILSTDSGRATQLASVIKKMTPEGYIQHMEHVAKRMESQYEKRTNKPVDLSLTEEEKERYRQAKTPEERNAVDLDVSKRIGEQTSDLTWREKMRNWRYFSMLANARTHLRNITGNTMMVPIVRLKDTINAGLQVWDTKRSSDKMPKLSQQDRTTTAITKRADAQTRTYVENELNRALPIMQGVSSKYIESAHKAVKGGNTEQSSWEKFKSRLTEDVQIAHLSNSTKWVGRLANRLSSVNSNALEMEDALFLGLRFKSSMYQQIQAKDLDVSKITAEQRNQITSYAMEEALRSTFRDASALADAINDFANSGKVQKAIVEGLLPFKKTPINIAKRSIEYSPLGLIQGAYKMISNNSAYKTSLKAINEMKISDANKQYRIAKLNQEYINERVAAIDRLASGTTGSILTGLGILAASMGWITVKRKDDDLATFENSLGKSRYSLNIGDTSIDLSAFSPAAVPFIMGATMYELMQGQSDADGTPLFSAVIGSLCETIDPITEMSVISSFADAMGFSSYNNQDAQGTRAISTFAGNALGSLVGQFVPTIVGQLERTFDPYARSYSAGDDYWASKAFGSEIGTFAKNMQNKVGLGWLSEPKLDVHGEEVTNYTNFGSWVWNAANQTLLPATWKVDRKNDIDKEIVRLYGTVGDTNLFPTKPTRTVGSYTEDGSPVQLKLTNDADYAEYQKDYGQAIYDALEDLMASNAYQQMSDSEKATAIEEVIDDTKKLVKKLWKAKLIDRRSAE